MTFLPCIFEKGQAEKQAKFVGKRDTSLFNSLLFREISKKSRSDFVIFRLTGVLSRPYNDRSRSMEVRVYKGALYENLVAEALIKQGLGLYYYKREDSLLEEDFFVRTADELLPVEVKAGNNTSKSLSTLIRGEKYADVKRGIKLSAGNIGFSNGIFTFPYFCAFLLKRWLEQLGHDDANEETAN